MRPTRDDTFMGTAYLFAERGTCTRAQVGAVLVRDRRIIATGYNGAPAGMLHCTEVGCDELILLQDNDRRDDNGDAEYDEVNLGCQRAIHAEANCIAYAARHGVATEGSEMYCTHSPCAKCAHLMASAGIERFFFAERYRATPWGDLPKLHIFAHQWSHSDEF